MQKQSEKSILKKKFEWINSLSNSCLYHEDIAWCHESVDTSLLDISFTFRRETLHSSLPLQAGRFASSNCQAGISISFFVIILWAGPVVQY